MSVHVWSCTLDEWSVWLLGLELVGSVDRKERNCEVILYIGFVKYHLMSWQLSMRINTKFTDRISV